MGPSKRTVHAIPSTVPSTAGVHGQAPAVNPFPASGPQLPSFKSERSRVQNFLTATGEDLISDPAGNSALDNMGPAAADDSALEGLGPTNPRVRNQANGNLPGANHGTDQPLRTGLKPGEDPHAEVFAQDCYPAAHTCAKCHQKIYDEWRVSGHAYATLSPMFQKFEQKINTLASGTIAHSAFVVTHLLQLS